MADKRFHNESPLRHDSRYVGDVSHTLDLLKGALRAPRQGIPFAPDPAAGGDLAKLAGELEALRAQVAAVSHANAELKRRIEKIEKIEE